MARAIAGVRSAVLAADVDFNEVAVCGALALLIIGELGNPLSSNGDRLSRIGCVLLLSVLGWIAYRSSAAVNRRSRALGIKNRQPRYRACRIAAEHLTWDAQRRRVIVDPGVMAVGRTGIEFFSRKGAMEIRWERVETLACRSRMLGIQRDLYVTTPVGVVTFAVRHPKLLLEEMERLRSSVSGKTMPSAGE